jgi:glucose-6-phosphate isomerase
LRDTLLAEGYTHALLLGMGGSSLAPEVFAKTFPDAEGLRLSVLDSTDPGAVLAADRAHDPARTLYIVATKSGGTVETLSFLKYFYNRTRKALGEEEAGRHFIAITDPGSKLEALAKQHRFRAAYLNDPEIGGRFSALSYFGLLPAALAGVDVARIVERALQASYTCAPDAPLDQNPGAHIGAEIAQAALGGRDKLTFLLPPEIAAFGDWVEQLIAESTGKEGRGILPVVGEPLGNPGVYGADRFFVHINLEGQPPLPGVESLEAAGHPVLHLTLADRYDLGAQFFIWEFATAVAGHLLGVNPFDQPNVESAKAMARRMVKTYMETGALPRGESVPLSTEVLTGFLEAAVPRDYFSLQAYLNPTPAAAEALQRLRLWVRDTRKLATTLGFGPRYLHSTGQLHKGDRGNGLFVQLVSDAAEDVPIPDEMGSDASSMTFQTLKMAQALGDAAALEQAGRRVLRVRIGEIGDLEIGD